MGIGILGEDIGRIYDETGSYAPLLSSVDEIHGTICFGLKDRDYGSRFATAARNNDGMVCSQRSEGRLRPLTENVPKPMKLR